VSAASAQRRRAPCDNSSADPRGEIQTIRFCLEISRTASRHVHSREPRVVCPSSSIEVLAARVISLPFPFLICTETGTSRISLLLLREITLAARTRSTARIPRGCCSRSGRVCLPCGEIFRGRNGSSGSRRRGSADELSHGATTPVGRGGDTAALSLATDLIGASGLWAERTV